MTNDESVLQVEAAGVSLVIDAAGSVPRVLHWGAALGALDPDAARALRTASTPAVLHDSPDVPRVFGILPAEYDGWSGTPGQEGSVGGADVAHRPALTRARVDGSAILLRLEDRLAGLVVDAAYRMDPHGVLTVDLTATRDGSLSGGSEPYALERLRALLPVPARASELLDFTGKWCRERAPQRGAVRGGSHVRRARRGKPGQDNPFLTALGTPELGFRRGEVWACHYGWSGDAEYLVESLPEGAGGFATVLGAGEALRRGEVSLAEGERYEAPTAYFVWSDEGLDGMARRFHGHVRSRAAHPQRPRPLVLNTWEAVYFAHDLDRLTALARAGAAVGVERVVLDDGWFRGRRADDAGLGDWQIDEGVWPDGLDPFVDVVRAEGMQFGLWFEPEMVNLDSDLAREHPDWILGPRAGLGPAARHQYVLDIANPAAYAYLLEAIAGLVERYRIDFIKWDHNRELLEPVTRRTDPQRPAVHAQTRALYALLDQLGSRFPDLEIETCASGGGRVDLGILGRTSRLWASDCNDPVERARIERWTRLIVPPELIGSHIGDELSHTTGRRTDLSLRLATTLFAHSGIEADITRLPQHDIAAISAWSQLYREIRGIVRTGEVVNADLPDDAALTGVVAADGSRALYTWMRFTTTEAGQPGVVPFPGVDPSATYRVRVRTELGPARRIGITDPEWVTRAEDGGITLPGAVLATVGVPLPALAPQQAVLFDLERV